MKKHHLTFLAAAGVFLCLGTSTIKAATEDSFSAEQKSLRIANQAGLLGVLKVLSTAFLLVDHAFAFNTRIPIFKAPSDIMGSGNPTKSLTLHSKDFFRAYCDRMKCSQNPGGISQKNISKLIKYFRGANLAEDFYDAIPLVPQYMVSRSLKVLKEKLLGVPPEDVDDTPPTKNEIKHIVKSVLGSLKPEFAEYLFGLFYVAAEEFLNSRDILE